MRLTIDIETQKNGPGIFRARAGIQYNLKYQSLIKNTIKKVLFQNIKPGSNPVADKQRSLFFHRLDAEERLEKLELELKEETTSDELDLKIFHYK